MSPSFDPWTVLRKPGPQQKCIPCTYGSLASPEIRRWAAPLKHSWTLHRKLWEFMYICEVLHERGMLAPGKCGLGFAVGQEPLSALFATAGAHIVATDLHPERLQQGGADWRNNDEHAESIANLNKHGICPPEIMAERVQFRHVDMNDIPDDLTGFDFLWSSCSFEHLGSLELGKKFIDNMCKCLKPGGVAVHTTELNVYSNDETIEDGWSVIFRRRDIEEMFARVYNHGGWMADRDYFLGDTYADLHVDKPPYKHFPHLKMELDGFVATSFGIIVEKRLD